MAQKTVETNPNIDPIDLRMLQFMEAQKKKGTKYGDFHTAIKSSRQQVFKVRTGYNDFENSFTKQQIKDAMKEYNGNANYIFGLEDNMYRK